LQGSSKKPPLNFQFLNTSSCFTGGEVEEDGRGLIVEILGRDPGAEIFHETLIWSNINQIL